MSEEQENCAPSETEQTENATATWTYHHECPKDTARDIIFRTLMPGVFIYLVVYYAFAHDPFVADYYTKSFRQPQLQHHEEHPAHSPLPENPSPSTGHSNPAFVA